MSAKYVQGWSYLSERLVLSILKQIKGVACSLETSTERFLLIYTK